MLSAPKWLRLQFSTGQMFVTVYNPSDSKITLVGWRSRLHSIFANIFNSSLIQSLGVYDVRPAELRRFWRTLSITCWSKKGLKKARNISVNNTQRCRDVPRVTLGTQNCSSARYFRCTQGQNRKQLVRAGICCHRHTSGTVAYFTLFHVLSCEVFRHPSATLSELHHSFDIVSVTITTRDHLLRTDSFYTVVQLIILELMFSEPTFHTCFYAFVLSRSSPTTSSHCTSTPSSCTSLSKLLHPRHTLICQRNVTALQKISPHRKRVWNPACP